MNKGPMKKNWQAGDRAIPIKSMLPIDPEGSKRMKLSSVSAQITSAEELTVKTADMRKSGHERLTFVGRSGEFQACFFKRAVILSPLLPKRNTLKEALNIMLQAHFDNVDQCEVNVPFEGRDVTLLGNRERPEDLDMKGIELLRSDSTIDNPILDDDAEHLLVEYVTNLFKKGQRFYTVSRKHYNEPALIWEILP